MMDPLLPRRVEILSVAEEVQNVFTLDLRPPPDYGPFEAGQFNMLYVPGAGQAAISVSGDPRDKTRLRHTIRREGNVTSLLQAKQVADHIGLRGPFGQGWPLAAAEGGDLLLLGGGIGLAPLRPALYQALAHRERFHRISLLIGARSPEQLLYYPELQHWADEGSLELQVCVDSASATWRGRVGVITDLIPEAEFDPQQVTVLMCGPEIMQRFSVRKLRGLGVKGEAMYLSLERHMQCAVGLCGHCQLGPQFVCRDGPVFPLGKIEPYLMTGEF